MTAGVTQLSLSEMNGRDFRSRFAARPAALASPEAMLIELHASASFSHQQS